MTGAHAERQLLAIMFTDVVGYTALTERDEAGAVRVRDAHRHLVRARVEQFGGEVVDVTGDESLSIFPSALRAVECAIAIQGALESDPELQLRIGIHLGDVLRRDAEVIGEGVNVASRIRPLAEPGGICVSGPVYQLVRTRLQVAAQPLGRKAFKNVEEPIEVFSLASREGGEERAGRGPGRGRRRLPLVAALVALLVAGAWMFHARVIAWTLVNLPRLTGGSVEQEIGFAQTSDGVRIAYATSGSGPPLVLVIGWGSHLTEGMDSPLYDHAGFLSFYSREHLVVRYDGRGFGLSDRDIEEFSLEARVRDVEAVVDALGLERFALYAYSAGGPTGVAYAARHPDRVSQLVLAATMARPDIADPERRQALGSLTQFIETSWSPLSRAALLEFLAPERSEVEQRLLMHFLERAAHGPQIAGFFRAMAHIDASGLARGLRVPTLVVASDVDTTISLSQSRQLAALIPGARFEVVEGANHLEAAVQDPRVMQLVGEFLAEPAH